MKFGGNFSRVSSFSPDNRGYIWGFQQQFLNGEPDRVRFWNHSGGDIFNTERPEAPWVRGSALGLYAQDSITFNNRLTMTLGVRYDRSKSWMPAQCRSDSLLAALGSAYQAACFEENPEATSWSDLVPRIGAIYDLRGDGRTALKVNFSRYSNQQGVRWAGFLNPNIAIVIAIWVNFTTVILLAAFGYAVALAVYVAYGRIRADETGS